LSKLTVVISAAGVGRRMKTKGPKALIALGGGETVISRQIFLIRRSFPDSEIVVVVGHCADKVIRALPSDVRYTLNEDYEETNVARSFLLGIESCPAKRTILLCGDLVFGTDFLGCLNHEGSVVAVDRRKEQRKDEVGVNLDNEVVAHFTYGAYPRWAQAAALEGLELDLFRKIASQERCARWFAYEVLNSVIEKSGRLLAVHPSGTSLVEIDQIQDVIRARRLAGRSRKKEVAK